MIFGNLANLEDCPFLNGQLLRCFAYARKNDLLAMEAGSHPIDGEELFVNIVEYTTKEAETCFWEAHRQYLDLHLMLQGREQIDLNFIQNMKLKEYVQESDFLPMEGEKSCSAVLAPGDFLICYPSDGHRTAVAAAGPETIKKAIFKIRIR